MKVAYITHAYPVYSQTFSIDEVTRMRERGVALTVFSITKPQADLVTDALRPELERTSFVRPVPFLSLLRANVGMFVRHPFAYTRTALACFGANTVNVMQALKGVLHFIEAVELGDRLAKDQFDCIHVQFADTAATYAAVIHRLYDLPFSVAVHAHDIFEHRFTSRLIGFRIREAAWIRVISYFNRDFLQENVGIDPERMEVVRCGIDISKLRRSAPRDAGSHLNIFSVGRLVPYKGHDILIRACKQLKAWGLNPHCRIVGDGTEHKKLARLIDELDLKENVELVGVMPHAEICQSLQEATVFALACRRADDGAMDGIPVALMEAMAMELPVVTTAISGIPELVENGHNGLIAETEDVEDLARCIRAIATDAKLADKLARAAREKIESEFNQSAIGAVLADRVRLSNPADGGVESAVSVKN